MSTQDLKTIKRKKNRAIISVLLSIIALITIYVLALKYEWVNRNVLEGSFLIIGVMYLFFIIHTKNAISAYVYRYNYLMMIEENMPPRETALSCFTQAWEERFIEDGFLLKEKNSEYAIYYQFSDHSEQFKAIKKALLCVVLSYQPKLDFYGQRIQTSIKQLYEKYDPKNKVKKEIIIQVKLYEEQTYEEVKPELQRIINYKSDGYYIVHIPVGYFKKKRSIYYLRPSRRYPNRYYYEACQIIERYC